LRSPVAAGLRGVGGGSTSALRALPLVPALQAATHVLVAVLLVTSTIYFEKAPVSLPVSDRFVKHVADDITGNIPDGG
nr:hypothetical protein [Tanacetum cinerariifolium]